MSQRAPDSPKSKKPAAVSELVLQTCRAVDTSAIVASVLRDSEGRTVVRIRTAPQNDTQRVLAALETMWPLAQSSVRENPLDGFNEAEITVPRRIDEQKRAWRRASGAKCAEFLLLLSYVLLFVSLIFYVHDCKAAFAEHSASFPETPGEL